jgi:predicted dehydrogenase
MPDVANLHFEFPSGIQANVEISWLAPSKLRRSVIVGSRAMLVYDDTNASERVKLYDRGVNLGDPQSFGEYQLTYRTGEIVSPNVDATEPLLIEANHFLDCIETGECAETNGLTGLDVVVALEAASESMKTGCVVEIPRRQIDKSATHVKQAA